MKIHPTFSIIIPTKNEANNIGSCLDSIFSIRYPREKFEVIVVDNGSTDSTCQIAHGKGAKIFTLPEVSISALRNYGAKQASGEILAFIDADCTVEKQWLQKAEPYAKVKSIVSFGSAPIIPEFPTWVQATWYYVRKKSVITTDVKWLESMNMFVRKDIFNVVKGFDENLATCEDVDLSYRLSHHGRILSDQRIVAIHHGEARTIAEFFRKEKWRGNSNYLGIKAHGLRKDEIPSLILPMYYYVLVVTFISSCIFSNWRFVSSAFLLWQMPVLLLTWFKLYKFSACRNLVKLWFLYNVYFCARGMAITKNPFWFLNDLRKIKSICAE